MDLECRGREKTQAFEMRCYQRLCNILYKDHVTDKEVCRKIQAAIGEYDKLLTLVKKQKLRWFGHVSKSSGVAKTNLQGTVKGKRRGGHKKRWEDNIKEWTGMEFVSSTRAAENRTRWKGIVDHKFIYGALMAITLNDYIQLYPRWQKFMFS